MLNLQKLPLEKALKILISCCFKLQTRNKYTNTDGVCFCIQVSDVYRQLSILINWNPYVSSQVFSKKTFALWVVL